MSANTPERVAAVLLAAGRGRRFVGSTHKLLADIEGRPVWRWSLEALQASGLADIIVVTGAADLGPLPDDVTAVHNPTWQDGQATSLLRGVQAAATLGADAVVIGLADQPGVTAEAWRRVAACTAPIAIAVYDDQRAHPVRIHQSLWHELPTQGDFGARGILARYADAVEAVPCEGSPDDIDTAKDLERWLRRSPTNSP